jgi:hypothetical protein
MSTLDATSTDRYRQPTDEVRSRLIDDSIEALGLTAWREKFDIDPEIARRSIDCVKTRWYTDWGVLVCNHYPTAWKISKELIDKLERITIARDRGIKRHELRPHPTSAEKKSTEQHRHFNRRLEDLTRMLTATFERIHSYEDYKSPSAMPTQEVQGQFQRLQVDGSSELGEDDVQSPSYPGSPTDRKEDCIQSQLGSEAGENDTTQGDIDNDGESSIDQYCEDMARIRSTILKIWERYLHGEVNAVNAALVANFGLHLMEIRTSEATATIITNSLRTSTKSKEGDNLFWRAIQKRHQIVTTTVRRSETSTERERALQIKNDDAKYLMPLLNTLLQYQTGKSNRVEIEAYWGSTGMSHYGHDLDMGNNGGFVRLAEGDDLSTAKYDNSWRMRSAAIHLREAEQLGRANKMSKQACFRESDRITQVANDWVVGTKTMELPDHYPASLYLLLGVIKACMIAETSTKDALLEIAGNHKKKIKKYLAAGVDVSPALRGALEYANVIVDDRVRVRYGRATNNSAIPAHLHLESSPILSGVLIFNQLFLNRKAAHEDEMEASAESFALQLYNMERQIGGLDLIWDDAEFVIEQRGCQKVFGQDTRPATWPDILRCFRSSAARAKKASCAQPSQLMELLYNFFFHGDSRWMRNLQRFVCAHLTTKIQADEQKIATEQVPKPQKRKRRAARRKGKGGSTSTDAKATNDGEKPRSLSDARLHETANVVGDTSSTTSQEPEDSRNPSATLLITTLTDLIAGEEMGWHFFHYGFRVKQCAKVISVARDALRDVFGFEKEEDPGVQSVELMEKLLQRMNSNKRKREETLIYIGKKMVGLLEGVERQGILEMEEASGLPKDRQL